jgi:hypothetical protein
MRTVEDSLEGLNGTVRALQHVVSDLLRKTKKLRPSNTCSVTSNAEPTSGVAIVDSIDCVRLLMEKSVGDIRRIVEELALTEEDDCVKAHS